MKERQFYDENEQKRVNKLVDDMTLFDDDLMSHVFDKNIEATELILRIILGEDIKVISVEGQDELKELADLYAGDLVETTGKLQF